MASDNLPADFDQWDLATPSGWTVAHEAAQWGCLPDGFDQWALVDDRGRTVASVAAEHGYLPEEFDQADLLEGPSLEPK